MVIDAHMHVIPPAVLDLAAAGRHPAGITLEGEDGTRHVVHQEGYRYPLEPAFHERDALLAALAGRGAQGGIVGPAPSLFGYDMAPAPARAAAALVNDGVAAMVADSPGRLGGLATLPLATPGDAVAELERAVRELGLLGAEVGPLAAGRWLDDPELLPLLQAAEQLGAVLFVHPYYTGPKAGLQDLYLTNLVGNPLDTGLCAARLILSGTLDRVPDLRIMLAHGGGYLPYQAGRLAHGNAVRPELGLCAHVPTDYLARFVYDTILFSPPALRFLLDAVGAANVVYGSDEPFDMSGGPVSAQLGEAGLDEEELRAVSGGSAAAAFGFAPVSSG